MTDIRARLAETLRGCLPPGTWDKVPTSPGHITDELFYIPGIAIVDREALAKVIAGGIQAYADSESLGYSYHGDGSALESIQKLDRESRRIAEYILTNDLFTK